MQKRSRGLWAILIGIPVLLALPVVLIGAAVHQTGTIEFRVLEKHDGGTSIGGSIPAVILPIAAHIAPHHILNEIHAELDEEAEWALDVMQATLEELSGIPDCVLVDVRDGNDIIQIEKRDGKLELTVDTPDEAVSVSMPIGALAAIADVL